MNYQDIRSLLGEDAYKLLDFNTPKVNKDRLAQPGANWVSEQFRLSNRNPQVLANLERIYNTGRLANTGYLSILPVDQAMEHTAAYSFVSNPDYFDPENIITLAIDAECSAVASTFGVLGLFAKKYADTIPFIVKVNHNELLSFPNQHRQRMYGTIEQVAEMGAAAIGATIYFGSPTFGAELAEVRDAFAKAHELGLATVLWCYVRNSEFTVNGVNHETAADLTSQAIHIGVTVQADIIKQKLPTHANGMSAIRQNNKGYSKYDERVYTDLMSDHPIDLTRFQVLHSYAGRISMINSGGESGEGSGDDLKEAVKVAVINKRAGGAGLIMGRKAFKKSRKEGIAILQAVQDVYLCSEIGLA